MIKILCATSNANKIKECERLFHKHNLNAKCYGLGDTGFKFEEPSENEPTLIENSERKVISYAFQMFMHLQKQNRQLCEEYDYILAEDFGFCVCDYPEVTKNGVFSKRVLENMNQVDFYDNTDEGRNAYLSEAFEGETAEYISAISLLKTDEPSPTVHMGKNYGKIVKPRGNNGFAFDFILQVGDSTVAELSDSVKDEISSRSLAVKSIANYILETHE